MILELKKIGIDVSTYRSSLTGEKPMSNQGHTAAWNRVLDVLRNRMVSEQGISGAGSALSSSAKWVGAKPPSDEEVAEAFVDNVIYALSPWPRPGFPEGRDLEIAKKAMVSVYGAMEEGILSEEEATALINFLASKFVAHRFTQLMAEILGGASPSKEWRSECRLRGIREA